MREVSAQEFFATIGRMNVHPNSDRHETRCETPQRQLIGRSTPGYIPDHRQPKRWFLAAPTSEPKP